MELSEGHFVECGLTVIVKKVAAVTYTVTASINDIAGNGATLDPEGEIVVSAGDSIEFTITNPGTDPVFAILDDESMGELGSENPETYTLENIQTDHTVVFNVTGYS